MSHSPNNNHCVDVESDRKLGAEWDRRFCVIAANHGKLFTPHQLGRKTSAAAYYRPNGEWRRVILPDITIWSGAGEHHEVKHKNPKDGCYGLECYRLDSLIEFDSRVDQFVYYTIHDWTRVGRDAWENNERDWITCDIRELVEATRNGVAHKSSWPSYVGGKTKYVSGWWWPTYLWRPLISIWGCR